MCPCPDGTHACTRRSGRGVTVLVSPTDAERRCSVSSYGALPACTRVQGDARRGVRRYDKQPGSRCRRLTPGGVQWPCGRLQRDRGHGVVCGAHGAPGPGLGRNERHKRGTTPDLDHPAYTIASGVDHRERRGFILRSDPECTQVLSSCAPSNADSCRKRVFACQCLPVLLNP